MKTYFAVTGVVRYKDRFLILHKAPDDYNYPGCWSFCSGYAKEFQAAEDEVLREIKEETGLDSEIIFSAKVIEVIDKNKRWVIAPFLLQADSDKVRLDHENTEYRWVKKEELKDYNFVPGLLDTVRGLKLV